ncbi:protein kinase, partial [Micromonospora sp. NPDC051300]|uniref:protein kinase domain-containing protein n=1 Tax=Micromonospora sp. NPDC051300 TaxID=3364286 RepID=UPI0037A9A5A5
QHPYLIMELCDGSYAERMRTSPLGPAETRDLGVKIADALAHSHAAGVLHRDVKPANILHSEFNSAVLADFGLAVLAEVRDASVTLEVLTPAYAPPEMFSHSPPSPAVDVYALCATLYAVMHGRPPRWQSERNPSLVTVLEMFQHPIPGLPGVPEELIDVLRLGMSNDPGERPSAVELRGMLAALPLDPGTPAAPFVGTGGPYGRPGGPSPRQPVKDDHPTVPARSRRWPRRWFLGGAGVLALAASAGGGAWLAGGSPPAVSPTVLATGVAGATTLPGCASADVRLPTGARCGSELECYGPVRLRRDRAEASRVPCDGQHTWETYAAGDLPASLAGAAHDAVTADPGVRRICNTGTFRLVSGVKKATGWNLEVLPPAATEADRTYRCLAGQGVNALARPTLTGR